MTTGHPDDRHINAAIGYCELQMFEDARNELALVSGEQRDSSNVTSIELAIHQGLKEWGPMQELAGRLAGIEPANVQWHISWAYATRRAESIEAARKILLEAVDLFPEEPLVHYNLACYECRLGDLSSAETYLKNAFKLAPQFRTMASEDEDLIPLKKLIRSE